MLRRHSVHEWRGRFYDDRLTNIADLERIVLAHALSGGQFYAFRRVALKPLGFNIDGVRSDPQEVELEIAVASRDLGGYGPGFLLG